MVKYGTPNDGTPVSSVQVSSVFPTQGSDSWITVVLYTRRGVGGSVYKDWVLVSIIVVIIVVGEMRLGDIL